MRIRSIKKTNFYFNNQTAVYNGKVRDVYTLNDDRLIMVASDRISAFDHILPRAIPFKGQVLNQIAAYFLQNTADICPNWLIETPDPNVAVGWRCEPIKVEVVVRGFLVGHAWRVYSGGGRVLCGVNLPDGMRENAAFPTPIITPTTKADAGHDEDISRQAIIDSGLVAANIYEKIEAIALKLFQRGQEMAAKQGLILVDTKYEFGLKDNQIVLMDEIHTPDSSRYFYAEGYTERLENGEPQRQLSKEFVREWLMAKGFRGREGDKMPTMPTNFVETVSNRYIELYEKIIGQPFQKPDATETPNQRIKNNMKKAGFL